MSDQKTNWLLGCGIGCGVVIMLCVAVIAGGFFFVRDTMEGFDAAIETRGELVDQFGEIGEFTPTADGSIPRSRMETFVTVREATQPARDQVVKSFSGLPLTKQESREIDQQSFFTKLGTVFRIGRSAVGLGAHIGSFFQQRNQALLDHQMGPGEYSYIYVLAYYSWLGQSPDDGPDNADRWSDDADSVEWELSEDDERGHGRLKKRLYGNILKIMRNQFAALPTESEEPDLRQWRNRLEAEIEALEEDRNRIPWQDGLPEALAVSLEPFRQTLLSSYHPMANEFELLRNRNRGGMSIETD